MGKVVFGMMQSLDGYVDDVAGTLAMPPPDATSFRHFTERTRDVAGSLYGRRIYEVMRYWDEDRPEWDAAKRDNAAAWRSKPKWVFSRSLKAVGPYASLVEEDLGAFVRRLKAEVEGVIEVAGPELAGALTDLGLIDEYQLYLRPFVLGGGKPFFARARLSPENQVLPQGIGLNAGLGCACVLSAGLNLSVRPPRWHYSAPFPTSSAAGFTSCSAASAPTGLG